MNYYEGYILSPTEVGVIGFVCFLILALLPTISKAIKFLQFLFGRMIDVLSYRVDRAMPLPFETQYYNTATTSTTDCCHQLNQGSNQLTFCIDKSNNRVMKALKNGEDIGNIFAGQELTIMENNDTGRISFHIVSNTGKPYYGDGSMHPTIDNIYYIDEKPITQ